MRAAWVAVLIALAAAAPAAAAPQEDVPTDTVAPAVTLALPAITRIRTQPFSGNGGTAPGDASQMTVTIRTGETVVSRYMLTAGAFTAQLPRVSDGVYTVTLTQTDEAGNVGVASQTVLVDATRPVIDRAAIAHHYFLGATVPTPAAICRDDLSGIASCDAPATLDTSALRFRTIAVTAVDRAGNRISGSVSYWVGRPPGPRLAIVSATAHRRGHVITVRARGTIAPGVTRPLLVAAGGHRVSVPVADGAWRATIRLRSHARKVVLKLVYDGDATHRAGRGHRTIRVR